MPLRRILSGFVFDGRQFLQSITIPDSVTSIEICAFSGCTGLTTVTFTGTTAEWNAITKGDSWNYNTGTYIIHCTDGDITK